MVKQNREAALAGQASLFLCVFVLHNGPDGEGDFDAFFPVSFGQGLDEFVL